MTVSQPAEGQLFYTPPEQRTEKLVEAIPAAAGSLAASQSALIDHPRLFELPPRQLASRDDIVGRAWILEGAGDIAGADQLLTAHGIPVPDRYGDGK